MLEVFLRASNPMKTKSLKPKVKTPEPVEQPRPKSPWFWWVLFAVVGIFAAINWDDYVVEKDGKLELAPKRKAKLKKELEQIDNAEQYVLKAMFPGFYPCINCGDKTEIWLNPGDVWKYGTTRLGEMVRYKSEPFDPRLKYEVEFRGNYADCLKMEKIQIYHYVLLPENQKRADPLIRPPGNPRDS